MNFLPFELLDIILQKSYLYHALNRDRFKNQSDEFLITRLATVGHCWFERLRKSRFRRNIWRRLSGEPASTIEFGFCCFSYSRPLIRHCQLECLFRHTVCYRRVYLIRSNLFRSQEFSKVY